MTTIVRDPLSGTFSSNADPAGTDRSMVALNGGAVPGAASQSPYDVFSKNLMNMLQEAQQGSSNAPLLKAKEQVNNQALNLSNPLNSAPYQQLFQGMTPTASLNAQNGTQNAFSPALTSINDQMANNTQNLNAFNSAIGSAYAINKPVDVSAGSSLISPNTGDVIVQGGRYTPTFNVAKGIMDGFDSVHGTWASDQSAVTTPQTPPPPVGPVGTSVVGGADLSKYAKDPNYPSAIASIYGPLAASNPTPNNATLDQYIKGHASKSPITGQMAMNAGLQYGVNPNLLVAMMAHESDFGTSGEAPKNNNPGGVLFVGQVGASQGSPRPANEGGYYAKYNSWQQGVNAMAEVVKRMSGSAPVTPPVPANTPAAQSGSAGGTIRSDGSVDYSSNPLLQGQSPYNVALINGLLNYQTDPSSLSTKGNQKQYYVTIAQRIDPTYSEAQYATRSAFQKDWGAGSARDQLVAGNTAIGHLAEVSNKFGTLNNSNLHVPGVTLWNAAKNAYETHSGNGAAGGYEQAQTLFSDELAKLYGGGAPAQAAKDQLQKYGGSSSSPDQEQTYLDTGIGLMSSKLGALADQYQRTMGRSLPNLDAIISPQNQVILAKVLAADGKSLRNFIPGVPVSASTQQLLGQGGDQLGTGLNQSSQSILSKYGIK